METNITYNSSSKYYIASLFAIIGWGLSTSFVEFGLAYIDPYEFLALRFLLAVLIATPFILISKRNEVFQLLKSPWMYIIATCETSGLLFQYVGQLQQFDVSAGLASLLTMMFIMIVPALSYYFLKEKFTLNHAIAIVLGFIGILFIVTQGNLSNLASSSTIGVILLLLSATSYAFYQLSTSKYTREINKEVDSIAMFYAVMIAITIFSFVVSFLKSSFIFHFNVKPDAWLWIAALSIFSTIMAFTGYFYASKGIQANTLSILLISQMLVPFFVDIAILGKQYSLWVYTGGLIIVMGMIFIAKLPTEPKVPVFVTEVPSKQI